MTYKGLMNYLAPLLAQVQLDLSCHRSSEHMQDSAAMAELLMNLLTAALERDEKLGEFLVTGNVLPPGMSIKQLIERRRNMLNAIRHHPDFCQVVL